MNTVKQDNLFVGDAAQAKVIAGIDKAVNAVKLTLGAKGINGMMEMPIYPFTVSTNDGISLLNAIQLSDPLEMMGVNLVKETSGRHNKNAGDGSTTTAVLLQSIIHEGLQAKEPAIEVMRSLEACLPIIEKAIDDQTKPITPDEVGMVATISAEDEQIGAMIQEIYKNIGKDGILYPDVSKTFEDIVTYAKGIEIEDAGFASPYMADIDKDTLQPTASAYIKNAQILVVNQKIMDAKELNSILGQLNSNNIKELIIFADDFEPLVVSDLIRTRVDNGFRVILIKIPVLWKDWWFEDIAAMSGATILQPSAGVTLKSASMKHLGKFDHITITKSTTFIDGIKDITEHLQRIEAIGNDDSKIRAARLNRKTARLFVGAHSDTALKYKALKVEDARNSAYQALQQGVVAGGGVTLVNVANILGNALDTVGSRILSKALLAPAKQIAENAGHPGMVIGADYSGTHGYNAKTDEFIDMFEAGILDPAMVVKSAVRNAISVAAKVLTDKIFIVLPERQENSQPTMPVI